MPICNGRPLKLREPIVSDDVEVDLLCVGSGAGGMSAAITAADAGASVLVVEKDTRVGGVTGISSGQCWLGANTLAAAAGIDDSREATLAYLGHLSQGLADPDLQKVFVDKAPEVIDYLSRDIGIPFMVVRGYPDYYYPAVTGSMPEGRYIEVAPFPAHQLGEWADRCIVTPYGPHYAYTTSGEWVGHQDGTGKPIWECLQEHMANDERCAGAGLAAYMLKAALDRSVEFWLESPATGLLQEEGRVTGAVIETPRGTVNVRARRGVLLATSGYDWNRELVTRFEALPDFGSMSPPTVEGDHLAMAAGVGAIPYPARAPAQTPVFIGYKVPHENVYDRATHRMLIPGAPHSIIVNHAGQRFANDSFYPDVATRVGRFDGQQAGMANWPAWLVFDDRMREKYGLLPAMPGEQLPAGMAVSAGSLAELAALAGIDPEGLAASVARFNGFCEQGIDEDFARGSVPWGQLMSGDPTLQPNPNMAGLEQAPFHAVKLERVVMGVPTVGLKVNAQAQVINASGQPVSGLYAAGNSTAWLDIGGGYNSGIANTRGLMQGYLAARDLMERD
jgi:3-oxosteroid 1-dehydrogenase